MEYSLLANLSDTDEVKVRKVFWMKVCPLIFCSIFQKIHVSFVCKTDDCKEEILPSTLVVGKKLFGKFPRVVLPYSTGTQPCKADGLLRLQVCLSCGSTLKSSNLKGFQPLPLSNSSCCFCFVTLLGCYHAWFPATPPAAPPSCRIWTLHIFIFPLCGTSWALHTATNGACTERCGAEH